MTRLFAKCQSMWVTRDRGATAVEYGLMVALIAMAVLGAVTLLGTRLIALFNGVGGEVVDATP